MSHKLVYLHSAGEHYFVFVELEDGSLYCAKLFALGGRRSWKGLVEERLRVSAHRAHWLWYSRQDICRFLSKRRHKVPKEFLRRLREQVALDSL